MKISSVTLVVALSIIELKRIDAEQVGRAQIDDKRDGRLKGEGRRAEVSPTEVPPTKVHSTKVPPKNIPGTEDNDANNHYYDYDYYDDDDAFAPTPAPIICLQKELSVAIVTDDFASETSWTLTNLCTGELQESKGSYSGPATNIYCVPEALYDFTINDSYGDGICCAYGEGSYSVVYDGEEVASGGDFGSGETTGFGSCEGEEPPPTPSPTTAPPTPSPTTAPTTASPTTAPPTPSPTTAPTTVSPTTAPPTPSPTTAPPSLTPPTTLECNIEMMKGNYKLKWDVYDHDLGKYQDDLVKANLRVNKPSGGGKGVMTFDMCVLEGENGQDSYLESMVAVTTGFARDSIISVLIGTSYAGEYNCQTEELMIGTGYNEKDLAFSLKQPAAKKDGGVGFPGSCS